MEVHLEWIAESSEGENMLPKLKLLYHSVEDTTASSVSAVESESECVEKEKINQQEKEVNDLT